MSDPVSQNNAVVAAPAPVWDKKRALKTYQVRRWGAKYLDINAGGRVSVSPLREAGTTVDLFDVVQQVRGRGLKFPLLIRFQDILRDRVVELNESFARAITAAEYKGRYMGVFPIKVNQLREVVEEILDAGQKYQHGLEVGSKSELCAAMALMTGAEQYGGLAGMQEDYNSTRNGQTQYSAVVDPDKSELNQLCWRPRWSWDSFWEAR